MTFARYKYNSLVKLLTLTGIKDFIQRGLESRKFVWGKCKDSEDKHCLIELLEEGEEGAQR